MEAKFVIVLVACLSCLVPPALSGAIYVEPPPLGLHAAVGAAAGAAIKGVAVLGAKAALATVGVLAAKGLAAKALLAKGAIAGAGAALAASHVHHHVEEHVPETSVVVHAPRAPTILGHIAEVVRTAAAAHKSVVHSHYYRRPDPVHVVPVVHKMVQPVAIVGPTMTVHEHIVGADGC